MAMVLATANEVRPVLGDLILRVFLKYSHEETIRGAKFGKSGLQLAYRVCTYIGQRMLALTLRHQYLQILRNFFGHHFISKKS